MEMTQPEHEIDKRLSSPRSQHTTAVQINRGFQVNNLGADFWNAVGSVGEGGIWKITQVISTATWNSMYRTRRFVHL